VKLDAYSTDPQLNNPGLSTRPTELQRATTSTCARLDDARQLNFRAGRQQHLRQGPAAQRLVQLPDRALQRQHLAAGLRRLGRFMFIGLTVDF
jgi:hypothetical protein